ncbi:MAG: D-alanyl-D-alanine carboxypeptidase [Comamonadaceae bacterium]|nr:MAG: D-alanyl-D-alanine carboxypeptidase [Comamonadaceae bacterium]
MLQRPSFQRFKAACRLLAVTLCATAFLLPGAHASSAKKPAASAKKAVASDSKRSASASKSPRTAKAVPAKAKSASSSAQTKTVRAGRNVTATIERRGGKTVVAVQKRSVVRVDPPAARLSYGQMAGLHQTNDVLDLSSSVALVVDQDTHEVLFSKNDHAVLPIASLTKLMTGLLISEARLPMEEMITITQDDVDTEKGSRSRLAVGTTLSRGELLHLALMSSENRAAHALGRTYPGGMSTFVSVMNAKARLLGMNDTRYVEPTGLSPRNQSTAQDLAVLVSAASQDTLVRQLSTSPERQVEVGARTLQYNTTNRLVRSADWEIGLQKTGYISEAGQCLVMQAKVAGRKLIMVFLDSAGRVSRLADAERVRRWVEATHLPTQGLPHLNALAAAAGD